MKKKKSHKKIRIRSRFFYKSEDILDHVWISSPNYDPSHALSTMINPFLTIEDSGQGVVNEQAKQWKKEYR